MSLLDALGLGFFGSNPAPYMLSPGSQIPYGQYGGDIWRVHCPHNDCPICKKEYESRAKQINDEAKAVQIKKVAYEKRCKEYMRFLRGVLSRQRELHREMLVE